jgi:hypothetical protein
MSNGKDWGDILYNTIGDQIRAQMARQGYVNVGVVKSLSPLTVTFMKVDFSTANDTLYCNSLLLDENINLDVETELAKAQNITEMKSPPLITVTQSSSEYTAKISGSIPNFIKDFYNYFKAWHNRFILHVGDFVAVQKVGENKILVVSKINLIGDNAQ